MDSYEATSLETVEIFGYRRNIVKTIATYVAVVLSGFTLLLFFYWKPELKLLLTHSRVVPAEAEFVLLINSLGQTEVQCVYVQSLWSNKISRFLSSKHSQATEMSPISQETGQIDGLPTTIRFFAYRNLKYIWKKECRKFKPLVGLDGTLCRQLVQSKPIDSSRVDYLAAYYGLNVLQVSLTPICTKIVYEVLSPFYLFQIFSVGLWLSSDYYIFASVILAFSVISIFLTVCSCRKNELELLRKIQMADEALVIRSGSGLPMELPSSNLVPGDIVCIPKNGCEMTADVLILNGDAVVNESALTGESAPQVKSAISEISADEVLDLRLHSRHILYSGTTVLQAKIASVLSEEQAVFADVHKTPFLCALVLRTGFLTTKGSLVRTILYPKPLDINFTIDAFRFLSVMAVIAIAGSVYTWVILSRSGYQFSVLIKKSLDVLTIVVPPALPAVMTTGLFLAQLRLKKHRIFCINPSAINVAGTLDTMVFDKTGTLTDEDMSVKGVWLSGIPSPETEAFHRTFGYLDETVFDSCIGNPICLAEASEVARQSSLIPAVLAACHSLCTVALDDGRDSEVVGDPLEKVIFFSTNWKLMEASNDDVQFVFKTPVKLIVVAPQSPTGRNSPWGRMGILRQFPFTSSKQRQSVIAQSAFELTDPMADDATAGVISFFCKGSPEAVVKLCRPSSLPCHFDQTLRHFTSQGYRVIAFAWKPIGRITDEGNARQNCKNSLELGHTAWETRYSALKREELETDLHFLGLVILDNPVKPESAPTIKELTKAELRVLMATGDDLRTGLSVARQCGIIAAEDEVIQVSPSDTAKNALLSGASTECDLSKLLQVEILSPSTLESCVYGAVTSDELRESSSTKSPSLSWTSFSRLLCGSSRRYDYENIGLPMPLLEGDDAVNEAVDAPKGPSFSNLDNCEQGEVRQRQHIVMTGDTWNLICNKLPKLIPTVTAHGTVFARFLPDDKTSLICALQTAGHRVGMCGDGANDCGALKAAFVGVALSDCEASIAAPFTCATQNISCVSKLLREGRCSLATAIGSFKFMVLYSFIQFFSVLILYYIGNALTDAEFLIIDLFVVTPLSITFAASQPWRNLEASTPALRLLTPSNLISVLSQLFLAVISQFMMFILVRRQPWWKPFLTDDFRLDSAGSYEATCIFYFSIFQYITVGVVFARGPPFRERCFKNVPFLLNIIAMLAVGLGLLFCPTPGIVEWAKLLPLHGEEDNLLKSLAFPSALLLFALIYAVLAYCVETLISALTERLNSQGLARFYWEVFHSNRIRSKRRSKNITHQPSVRATVLEKFSGN